MDALTSACPEEDTKYARQFLLNVKWNSPAYISRDDNEEMLNLAIFYIEKESLPRFFFSTFGNAALDEMDVILYLIAEMLLLQQQLSMKPEYLEKLQRFSEFVAVYYSSHWFQSPLDAETAFNAHQFCKKMLEYQTIPKLKQVADTVIQTLDRHLWYLTEELVPVALCYKQLTPELKEILGRKLLKLHCETHNKSYASQKPIFPTISERTKIPDLAGKRLVLLFQHFNLSINDFQFLSYALNRWPLFEGFKKLEKFVVSIKVTSDTAERRIKYVNQRRVDRGL